LGLISIPAQSESHLLAHRPETEFIALGIDFNSSTVLEPSSGPVFLWKWVALAILHNSISPNFAQRQYCLSTGPSMETILKSTTLTAG
jgi:hypothetical protein